MDKFKQTSDDEAMITRYTRTWKTPLVALQNIYNSIGLTGIALSYPILVHYEGMDLKLAALARLCTVGSLTLSTATLLGFATVEYYEKTLTYFKNNGKIDDAYLKFFLINKGKSGRDLKTIYKNTEGTWYCQRRGVELAMKELGLGQQWSDACLKYGVNPDHDKRLFLTQTTRSTSA
jgi:hypothetical protein